MTGTTIATVQASPMPGVTAPVRRLLARMERADFRLNPTAPYRGGADIGFDNDRPMGDGAMFGGIVVGARTGRFLRGHVWVGGRETSYQRLPEFSRAFERALGDLPL